MEMVLEVNSIVTRFGSEVIHDGVSFSVKGGEVVALIGGSGTGKSVLLKEVIGLMRPCGGEVHLLGTDVWNSSENIAVPFREHTNLSADIISSLVGFNLDLVGLTADTGRKSPAQLSGGMRKRVALARALTLEPEILFLDEPTSGLDPVGARAFDKLVRVLSDSFGLTVFLVTHDLDTLLSIIVWRPGDCRRSGG